jgi:hypothetical protein
MLAKCSLLFKHFFGSDVYLSHTQFVCFVAALTTDIAKHQTIFSLVFSYIVIFQFNFVGLNMN